MDRKQLQKEGYRCPGTILEVAVCWNRMRPTLAAFRQTVPQLCVKKNGVILITFLIDAPASLDSGACDIFQSFSSSLFLAFYYSCCLGTPTPSPVCFWQLKRSWTEAPEMLTPLLCQIFFTCKLQTTVHQCESVAVVNYDENLWWIQRLG